MAQDLRELLQNAATEQHKTLPKGHKARFAERLEKELPARPAVFLWWKIAAVAIMVIGVGSLVFFNQNNEVRSNQSVADTQDEEEYYTLSDLSPELKKVENFYLTGIQMELAKLEVTENNKDFISGYMKQLKELDDEYALLNKELNQLGPSEETIEALIENLQRRLDLIIKLKNKLHQFNQSKNEQFHNQQA